MTQSWYKSPHNNIIGRFHGTDIPVTIDLQAFYQHILVCGATGSGKSNSVANLLKAAQTLGACCLLFDHKPDYQDIADENDEKAEKFWGKFRSLGLVPHGLAKVTYFGLAGQERRADDEVQITVRASDVDTDLLAAALFPSRSEDNQRDLFLAIIDAYKARNNDNKNYSLASIRAWVDNLAKKKADSVDENESEVETDSKDEKRSKKKADATSKPSSRAAALGAVLNQSVNQSTLDAMERKIMNRKPRWLDALVGTSRQSTSRVDSQMRLLDISSPIKEPAEQANRYIKRFDFTTLARKNIVVLRIRAEGREYGLFLSYMLNSINRMLASRKLDFPIVCFIDEAHEIFRGERAVAEAATAMTMRAVNTGRSLGNGFVFATQNPSQVPTAILNNLNSRIIHRQNEEGELKLGIPGAPPQLVRSALGFGSGEALVYIQGSRAPVRTEMAPSPFKLTKLIGPGARKFLIDQIEEPSEES